MKKVESNFLGMTLSLTIICLVTAGLLSLVYNLTLEPIDNAKIEKQKESLSQVLPIYDSVEVDKNDTYTTYKAYKNNKVIAIAVETSENGFGGPIKLMVGFDITGKIINYSVLEHTETPGLGSKMGEWFATRIPGIDMSQDKVLKVSKEGGDIDAITAATITSKAFLNAINNAYTIFLNVK